MFDFYQKRKLRQIINSRYVQGFLLFLVILVGWSAYTRFEIAMEMSDRRQAAEAEAQELQIRKDSLSKEVEYLSNERGIEAEMRRQFDVALEGEQVVVILEGGGPAVLPLSTSTAEEDEASWYKFWR
jgi:cell division protein FtsB